MAQAASEDREDQRQKRGRTGWLATGTFILGLVAGVLLLGLLGQDPPMAASTPEAAADPTVPATSPAGPTSAVELNEACLRAINAAQDIAATVEDLGVPSHNVGSGVRG